MELKDCSSDRDGKGCLVEERGSLVATNVDVSRCEDEAFAIGEEGTIQKNYAYERVHSCRLLQGCVY